MAANLEDDWLDLHVEAFLAEKARRNQPVPTIAGQNTVRSRARTSWNQLPPNEQQDFAWAAERFNNLRAAIAPLQALGPEPPLPATLLAQTQTMRPWWRAAWDLLFLRPEFDVTLSIMCNILLITPNITASTTRTRVYLESLGTDSMNRADNGLTALNALMPGGLPAWRPSRFEEIVNRGTTAGAQLVPGTRSHRIYLHGLLRGLEAQVSGTPQRALPDIRGTLNTILVGLLPATATSPRDAALHDFLRGEWAMAQNVRRSFNGLLGGLETWSTSDALRARTRRAARATGPVLPVPPFSIARRRQWEGQLTLWEQHLAALRSCEEDLDALDTAREAISDPTTQGTADLHINSLWWNTATGSRVRIEADILNIRTALQNAYQTQDNIAQWLGNPVSPWQQRGAPIGGQVAQNAGNGQGNGSQLVEAWVKLDQNNAVIDRLAKKEVVNDPNPNRTTNPLTSGTGRPPANMPLEVAAMYKLKDLHGSSDSVVQIRNWRRITANGRQYIIYMDLCQNGSLHNVRRLYDLNNTDTGPLPPEPFVWSVFDSLADAGLLMERGRLRDGDPQIDALWDNFWNTIVHGDMKGDNVLLDINTTGKWSGYPRAKLADFGMSIFHPITNNGNAWPTWVTFGGNTGYRAPEHVFTQAQPFGTPGSKANVWGAGIIIQQLINRDWMNAPPGSPQTHLDRWTHITRLTYSEDLLNLTLDCLRADPANRPTFMEIKQSIIKKTGCPRKDAAVDMKGAPANDPGFTPALLTQNSQIPLALATNDLMDIDDPPPGGVTGALIGPPPPPPP